MSGPIHDRDPLSRSARDLIASARDGDAPRPEDRVRVRRALAVAIAASAGTAGASVSAAAGAKAIAASTASSAGGGSAAVAGGAVTAGLFTKVAIVVVAIGVSSGAIVAVNRYTSAPTTTRTRAHLARLNAGPSSRRSMCARARCSLSSQTPSSQTLSSQTLSSQTLSSPPPWPMRRRARRRHRSPRDDRARHLDRSPHPQRAISPRPSSPLTRPSCTCCATPPRTGDLRRSAS